MPRDSDSGEPGGWDGRTYYGRPQLKPAPFNNDLVGSYVFLAGLSGGAQLLSGLIDLTRGAEGETIVRRSRWLTLLAPTLGAACLICDLHTPQRFYNMLRVFKRTSPMSIGTWILMGFSASSIAASAARFLADHVPGLGWLRPAAKAADLPASITGAGLGTYTAALFSATSTPRWAAAPRSLAVKFAASSIASAAAALGLMEGRSRLGRDLDSIAVAALAVELAATLGEEQRFQATGVPLDPTDAARKAAVTTVGVIAPLALLLGSLLLTRRRSRTLSSVAALGILGGGLAMRIGTMADGDRSAAQPETSMRFAQPDNLRR